MLFPHPEAADQSVPPYGKLASQIKSFRALGSAALSEPGLRALCPEAFAAFDADPTPQARAKRFEAVCAVLGFSEAYVAAPFNEALANLRQVAPMLYELAQEESKAVASAVKTVFRSVFKGEGHLSLSAQEAQGFLEFVLDVLHLSGIKNALPSNQAIPTMPAEAVPALAAFLAEALGALNTHDAKSSHPSAQFQGIFENNPQPSRYLSSELFPSYLSGRSSGGPLQYASWLEMLLPFRISIEGRAPVAIRELLTSADARAELQALGITALSALPVIAPGVTAFDGKLMPRVRLKVPGTEGVQLNLIPANSMLKATAELGRRVQAFAAQQQAQGVREACLEGLEGLDGVDELFGLERFVDYALDPSSAESKQLAKDLAAARKAHKLPALDLQALLSDKTAPGLRTHIRRHSLSSKPQICGGAYLAEASSRGIYLFPAATYQQPVSVQELRRFHGGLQLELAKGIQKIRKELADEPGPQDKYRVREKWLPVRVQKKILEGHVKQAAWKYVELLTRLREQFSLTEEQRQTLVPNELSAIQHFVLDGVAAESAVRELAVAGTGVLNVNDRYAADRFVELVVAWVAKPGAVS